MFEFCTRTLSMSRGSAQRYTTAARLAVKFPQLVARVESGELHMATLVILRHHLTAENIDQLLELARGKPRYEVEELVAAVAPRPDVPSRMRKIATPRTANSIDRAQNRMGPLGDERFHVQFTADRELRDDINHVRDLMRHSNPDGDLEKVFKFCVRAGLERLQSRRLGVSRTRPSHPANRKRATLKSTRHIPRAVRRAVFERDGEQCTYRDKEGRRCPCTTFLELDHIIPRAKGGEDTVENLRVRCHGHNGLHAEAVFGKDFIEALIRKRKIEGVRTEPPPLVIKGPSKARARGSPTAKTASRTTDATDLPEHGARLSARTQRTKRNQR
jgi:5-methylcytosine-specific restriction endonuclease McrA